MTEIFIIAVTLVIVIYDIWIYKKEGAKYTISLVIGRWTQKRPWIILIWGVLAGHFFWPINPCF